MVVLDGIVDNFEMLQAWGGYGVQRGKQHFSDPLDLESVDNDPQPPYTIHMGDKEVEALCDESMLRILHARVEILAVVNIPIQVCPNFASSGALEVNFGDLYGPRVSQVGLHECPKGRRADDGFAESRGSLG
jgi:hypothetical protein